ncbi:hypothetical protein F2Q70_00029851 [Brassica cretica]|uniref:Uncharacterized protein n=1 Tax=Brassica cretica TaxID=69181 RepID=A0A8S9FF46_BRACR|nr:hypothetical protein F2Q70_00029851 [Brassica cretica]
MGILVTWWGFRASNSLERCLSHVLASLLIDTNAVLSIDSPSSPRQLPLARQTDHSSNNNNIKRRVDEIIGRRCTPDIGRRVEETSIDDTPLEAGKCSLTNHANEEVVLGHGFRPDIDRQNNNNIKRRVDEIIGRRCTPDIGRRVEETSIDDTPLEAGKCSLTNHANEEVVLGEPKGQLRNAINQIINGHGTAIPVKINSTSNRDKEIKLSLQDYLNPGRTYSNRTLSVEPPRNTHTITSTT